MSRLSKDQAIAIADALIARKVTHTKANNPFVGFVHPLYRFPELSALSPTDQAGLIQAAGRLADRQPSVLLSFLLFVLVLLSAIFLAPPQYQEMPTLLLIFILFGLPAVLIRRAAVHRHVLALLPSPCADA
jgi:hypothetical protein